MPYDTMETPSTVTSGPDFLKRKPQNSSGILSSMKGAGRLLVRRAKTRIARVLAGMMVAAAALCLPHAARAQSDKIQIQYSGVVANGTDGNPYTTPRGDGNVFGFPTAPNNLAGQSFIFTINLSDDNEKLILSKCPDGEPYASMIGGTNASTAPTATLKIGNGSFTFGTGGAYPLKGINWSIGRDASGTGCGRVNDSFNMSWIEDYAGGYSDTSGFGPAITKSQTPLSSGDLRISVRPTSVVGPPNINFHINIFNTATHQYEKYADGNLTPQLVSVSGITPLDYKATSAYAADLYRQVSDTFRKRSRSCGCLWGSKQESSAH